MNVKPYSLFEWTAWLVDYQSKNVCVTKSACAMKQATMKTWKSRFSFTDTAHFILTFIITLRHF